MFTTALPTPPADSRIIGAFVVDGVTHYTYADEPSTQQLPPLEAVQPAPARKAHVPFDHATPRRMSPEAYRAAYAADTRDFSTPIIADVARAARVARMLAELHRVA